MSNVLTAFLVIGAAASVAAWIAALCHEKGIRPFAGAVRFVRGLPLSGRLAVLPLFIALVVYGSVKNHSNERGEMSNEIGGESGFNRVERVEEDGFDGIVENAVISEDWLKFGGYEDWIYIGPGAWSFRYGSNFVERLAAFSSGKIRVLGNGGGDAILSLIGVPVSIAPMSNWGSLGGAESCFWHAETPSNTLVLTWQNALLNRRADSPVNIQAELFPSGRMRITHNLSGETVAETEYVPAPQLPAHVSLDEVKGRFADGNTNAYYYADVVVEKGPSIVTVRCDDETALGDYAVAAYPGETNRLPFLIGPKYEVESEAAFAHFGVADEEVLQTNLADRIVGLQWPVEISFEEGYAESGKMFEMSVEPDFLEGRVFSGSGRARSGTVGCACGCDVGTNGVVRISEDCSCNPCTIRGRYGYEGYGEEFEFNYYPKEDGEEEPAAPEEPVEPPEEPKPSVSVWFDKSAVIFEDEYENSPGETVPRRSTRTTLKCTAYGGERGGNLTVDLSGMGALKLVSGTPPTSRTLAQYETVEFEAVYEGEAASSQENGTVAKAKLIENETNIKFDDEAKMTVVEVEFRANQPAPELDVPLRHTYGICEIVQCRQIPSSPVLHWNCSGQGSFKNVGGITYYYCPIRSATNPIKMSTDTVEYVPLILVIEPSNVLARNVQNINFGKHPNEAGWIGMEFEYVLLPLSVSFSRISIEEVPSNKGSHTGHFSHEYFSNIWSHTRENGAGRWHNVREDNVFAIDTAQVGEAIPKIADNGQVTLQNTGCWYGGSIVWEIPLGWNEYGTTGEVAPVETFDRHVTQEFTLQTNGSVGVSKLNNLVIRNTNDVCTLNGVIQP